VLLPNTEGTYLAHPTLNQGNRMNLCNSLPAKGNNWIVMKFFLVYRTSATYSGSESMNIQGGSEPQLNFGNFGVLMFFVFLNGHKLSVTLFTGMQTLQKKEKVNAVVRKFPV
jgi:hypothetical protein